MFQRIPTAPYENYTIYVLAFTWKNMGKPSNVVDQHTDISGPSQPIVKSLVCNSSTAFTLRWERPKNYYNSIDYYILSHKSALHQGFEEIQFETSATHVSIAVSGTLANSVVP